MACSRGTESQEVGDTGERGGTRRCTARSSPELAKMALWAANVTVEGFGVKLGEKQARHRPHQERRWGEYDRRQRTADDGGLMWSR